MRALQEKEIKAVGSNETIKVDVRVVAATKEDLRQAVDAGVFRNDLFYRLSVIPIQIPTLKERAEDIPLLIEHFLSKICKNNNISVKELTPEVINAFMSYAWPGNVRELENVIERLVLISPDEKVGTDFLPMEILNSSEDNSNTMRDALNRQVAGAEKEMILEALERAGGNRTKAAKLLGISRASLYNKLNQYGI